MTGNVFLRHALATVAYRGGKALRGAPGDFSGFRAGPSTSLGAGTTTRSAGEILAHIGDLFDWAVSLVDGKQVWHNSTPGAWEDDVRRFFDGLARLDERLASDVAPAAGVEKLFQGPIADALTHIGQIALLRRLAGAPIRGENYFVADIAAGRVGTEQTAARREFD